MRTALNPKVFPQSTDNYPVYIEHSGWATNKGPLATKSRFVIYQQDWLYDDCWMCLCHYLGDWQWVRYRKEDCEINQEINP